MLNVHQDRTDCCESGPLAAKQKLVQIGGLAEDVHVLLLNEADPRSSYQVRDQAVKLSAAVPGLRRAILWPDLPRRSRKGNRGDPDPPSGVSKAA